MISPRILLMRELINDIMRCDGLAVYQALLRLATLLVASRGDEAVDRSRSRCAK